MSTVTTSSVALGEPRLTSVELSALTRTLAAHAPNHDLDGSFPWPGVEAAHDAGLLTATVGRRYEGRGLSAREAVDVYLALGEGDPSVALLVAMTGFCDEEHQDRSEKAGFDHHVVKPASLEVLQSLLEAAQPPELDAPR